MEGEQVRKRFYGVDACQHPGIEDLVCSDPKVWGMPLQQFIKNRTSRPGFLPEAGQRLLDFLTRYATPGIDVRVAVDANVPGQLILTLYTHEKSHHTVVWATIGSRPR